MLDGTPSSPALLAGLQAWRKGAFCSISSDTTPKTSAPRAAGIQDSTGLCAWLCFLTSQTGAPGLGSGADDPVVLGMGSALGLAVPALSISAAQCPVPPQSWHRHPSGAQAVFPSRPSRNSGGWRGDPGLADAPVAEHDAEEMRGHVAISTAPCNFPAYFRCVYAGGWRYCCRDIFNIHRDSLQKA